MGKKILWTVIVLVLIAAVAVGAYFFLRPDTPAQPPEQATEQTAAKNPAQTEQIPEQTEQIPEQTEKKTDFNVVIVHKDGTQKEMTLKIQEEFLGAALINAGVIEAEENRFGMHIKKADGEKAVFKEDCAYWAVYVGEEFATKSTDLLPVEGGQTYKLVYSEPVLEDTEEPTWYLLKHVFLPLARGQVGTDWDTVSEFFKEHGYETKIDEGTYGIRDPYRGWSHFGGVLTNANGYDELTELYYALYDGDEEIGEAGVRCRSDAGENPSYRIRPYVNNNYKSTEVASLKVVEDWIRSNG